MPPLRRSLPRAKYTSQHRLAQAQAEAPGQGSADRIPGTSLLIRNRRLPLQPDAHLNPTLRQHRKPYSHSHHRGSNSATTCIGDHAHAQPMLALESSAPTSCSPACDLKGESSCDSKTKNDAHRKLSLAVPLDATAPEELHGNCPSTPTPRDRLRKTRFRHQLEPREQLEQNGEAQLPEAMQVHGQEHCNNQVDDEAYVGAPLTFLAGPKGTVGLSPQDGDRSVHSPAYLNSAVPSAGENSGEFGDSGVSIQEDIEDCTEEDLGNNDVTDLDSDATHPDSAVSQHALPDPSVSPVHPRRDCVETDLCSLRPTATTSPARLINPRSSINTNRDHPSKSLHDVSMKAPTMLFHQPQKAPGATRALTSLQFQLGKESNRSCARDGLLEKEAPEAVSSDLAHNSTWIQSEQTHVSKMPQTGTPSPPFLPQCTDVEDASSTVPGRGGQGNTERRTPADLVFAPVSEGFGRIRAYTLLASGQQDQVNIDSQARLAVLGAFTDRVPDDEPNGCVKYAFSLNDDSLPDMHLAGTNSQVGMPTLPQSPRLHRDPSKPAETSPTAITSGELQQHSSHAPHAERSSSPRICQEAPLRPHPAGLGYCHNHDPNIEHGLADTCERPLPFQAAPQDAAVPSSFQPELEELLVPANASVDFGDVSFSSVGVEGADPTLESTTRPAHQIGVEKDRTTKPAIARPTHPRTSWAHAVADKLGRDWVCKSLLYCP